MLFIGEVACGSQIQAVVIGHFVVISLLYYRNIHSAIRSPAIIKKVVRSGLQRKCTSRTCSIDKGCSHFPFLVYLVLERDTEVVLTVVFGMEGFAIVDDLSLAVELAHRRSIQ